MNSSYWDQFEDANDDDYWGQFEDAAPSKSKRTTLQDIGRAPETFSRGAAAGLLSAPRSISGLLKHGAEKLAAASKKSREEQGLEGEDKLTDFFVKAFGLPEQLLEKIGVPTYQEVSEWAKKRMGDAEHEPSGLEKGIETAGGLLGGSLLTPGGSFGNAARAATTGLAATGAGIASGLDAGAGGEIGGALTLPAIVNMVAQIKSGKLRPTGALAKQLYQEGKQLGLSDAELTPILQSKGKRRFWGSLAQPTERAATAVETSESALGKLYDDLKTKSATLPHANAKQQNILLTKLDVIRSNLKKSKIKNEDKSAAIKKIEEMMGDVYHNGINPEEIVATWQDVNGAINWRSFKEGKKALAAVKEPLKELLQELAPTEAKRFETLNNMWGKLQNTAEKVRPTSLTNWLKLGDIGTLMGGLYSLALHGNAKVLGGLASKKGLQLLATEMLINPRLNNLMAKTIASATPGTRQAVIRSLREFQRNLKEFPDIYKEFNFSSLEDKKD